MTRLFLECAIRAALIVAGTATVLYVLRVKAARIKHRIWTAVALLMLLLPLWTAWGPKAPVRVLPPLTESTANQVAVPTSTISPSAVRPDNTSEISEPATWPPVSKSQALLLGIYLLGLFSLLARLAFGTLAAHKLIQQAALRDGRHTSVACAAPVTVGWLDPTVILPEVWQQWPQAQLDAVLTHECEHALRRDPLVQWLALLNRAVFWFHPAAWWLERELSSLAEEACDNAVLSRGYDARDYAETLMDMARAVIRSGARMNVVGVAMPGASLPQRIHRIVENVPAPRISRARMVCVAAACAITCAAFASGRLDRAQARTARSAAVPDWQTKAGGKMKFDVASVKRNTSVPSQQTQHTNVVLSPADIFSPTGGLFSATNYQLINHILFAYKLTSYQIVTLMAHVPKWASTTRYHIEARASGNPTEDQFRLMMQSLLADRFKLAFHYETRQLPVLRLVLDKSGKLGPHLRPHSEQPPCTSEVVRPGSKPPTIPGGFPEPCGAPMFWAESGRWHYTARDITIGMMAPDLTELGGNGIDRPTLDDTRLTGKYDLVFEWTPEVKPGIAPPYFAPDQSGPTFLEALKDQLGLKLVPETGPVDVLVIDHVEEPSPN